MPRPKTGQGKTLYIPQSKLAIVEAILADESDPTSKTNLEEQIDRFLMTIRPMHRNEAGKWFKKLQKYLQG